MNGNDYKKLRLLDELSMNGSLSQREIASRLRVSLGFVNGMMKMLLMNEYFVISLNNKNKRTYELTDKGLFEKVRLNYEHFLSSHKNYHHVKERIIQLFRSLESSGINTVIFLGSGKLAYLASKLLKKTSLELVGIIDPNYKSINFMGIKILNINELKASDIDGIVVTAMPQQLEAFKSMLHLMPLSKIYYLDAFQNS